MGDKKLEWYVEAFSIESTGLGVLAQPNFVNANFKRVLYYTIRISPPEDAAYTIRLDLDELRTTLATRSRKKSLSLLGMMNNMHKTHLNFCCSSGCEKTQPDSGFS